MRAVRGTLLDCQRDPWLCEDETEAVRYIPDGILVCEEGAFMDLGPADEILARYPELQVEDCTGYLIVPGFIDVHLHYAQTKIIGSFGRQLLEWLQTYTFPEELKFRSKDYADEVASFFFDQMMKVGVTTVQSFATTHPNSVHAFFQEAQRRNARVLCGLTGIDRENTAPDEYRDTAEGFYSESRELIDTYHGNGRCLYSISPRFAFGSTDAQLQAAGKLATEFPELWIQTHLSENPAEIKAVLEFFPDCQDYLGVYEKYGLVRKRFVAGHGIYLSESEFARLGSAEASVAFCPASNLFLGSGYFRWDRANHHKVRWGLGCDSGGGNTLSPLRTLDDAYKVGMLQVVTEEREKDQEALRMSAIKGLYRATLGSAHCLDLDDRIGSFDKGKEADFVVLDTAPSEVLDFRRGTARPKDSLQAACHQFFGLMMVSDPRSVVSTFLAGERVYTSRS